VRILFVSHSAALGGAERTLYSLATDLDRSRFSPELVVPEEGPLAVAARAEKIPVHYAKLTRWVPDSFTYGVRHFLSSVFRLPGNVFMLVRLIQRNSIDLVHTNTITVLDGAIAAKLCGIPHVWHIHEILPETLHLKPYLSLRLLYRTISSLSGVVIVVSEAVRESIVRVRAIPHLRVVHNGIRNSPEYDAELAGVDLRKELGIPQDVVVVAIIGAVLPIKGHADLIEAMALVKDQMSSVRLLIVGHAPDREFLATLVSRIELRGLKSSIHILGYRDDALDIMKGIDIVAIPSWVESFSLVALEAMALGKPVVATRSGGVGEIVEDSVTGFLVPPRDSKALAQGLITFARSSAIRDAFGRRGRDRVATLFSVRRFVVDMQNIYVTQAGP
jgi:glycosyltransferase involved in cell wall biosynthesis